MLPRVFDQYQTKPTQGAPAFPNVMPDRPIVYPISDTPRHFLDVTFSRLSKSSRDNRWCDRCHFTTVAATFLARPTGVAHWMQLSDESVLLQAGLPPDLAT